MPREKNSHRVRCRSRVVWLTAALLAVVATGCSDPRQRPAEQAIAEIDAAIAAAGTAPAKYVPGELQDVQGQVEELRKEYARSRYAYVLEQAPATLQAARALGPTAAAREAELLQRLGTEWGELVEAVPAELAAVAERFERAAKRRKPPSVLTAEEARAGRNRLRDALALWDRALQEQAAGHLPEAVTLAHQVQDMGRSVDAMARAGAAGAAVG
jgi:hypothetical protein